MVSISEVWDRTTEFLGDHLRDVLPIAIVAILIPASISASLQEVGASGAMTTRTAIGLLGFALSLLSLWGQLAIVSLAIDGGGARTATRRFGAAVGVFLLLLLAVGLVILALAVATAAIGGVDFSQIRWRAAGSQVAMPEGMNSWVAFLLLLLLAIFFALLVRLAPLTAVIVAERRGAGAIARAFRLTRGLGWKLLGVVLLYIVVSIVAQWAATAVFGSVLALLAGGEGPLSLAKIVTSVIAAAVQTVFTVLAAVFMAKLYLACIAREQKTGPLAAAPLS